MNKLTLFLLSGTLLLAGVGCDVARTSGDAPTSVEDGAQVENPAEVEETNEDASNEVRQDQLNADIRAREQRNKVLGDEQVRADSDLESEVRAKLEANIFRSQLTVEAENGNVVVAGTVPSQEEYETIVPLAKEIKGVKEVTTTEVKVVPANES
ncbi:MAG TPA: BON domain-containing protein [Coleofasciculaceae cyanobacterium]|jgi:osmotically-inducible protein OsmY